MQATKESAIAVLEIQADSAPLQRFVSQKHCTPLAPSCCAFMHPVNGEGRQPMSTVLPSVVARVHFWPAEQVSLMQFLVSTDCDPRAMQGFAPEPQHCIAAEAPMALTTTNMAMMMRDRIFVSFLYSTDSYSRCRLDVSSVKLDLLST